MVRAYIDESYSVEKGFFVVAGYIGSDTAWRKYEQCWSQARSPRQVLHLADLRLGSGKATRHTDLLRRLGAVPRQCGLKPIIGSASQKDYSDLVAGSMLEKLMEGYMGALCSFLECLIRVLPSCERVDLSFEQESDHDAQRLNLLKFWNECPQHTTPSGKPKLARWSALPKSCFTEAADLLAYAYLQKMVDANSQKAKLTRPILTNQKYNLHHFGKRRVGFLLEYIKTYYSKPIPPLDASAWKFIRTKQ